MSFVRDTATINIKIILKFGIAKQSTVIRTR